MSDIMSEKLGNILDYNIPPLEAYLLTQRTHLDILVNELDTMKKTAFYVCEFTADEVYDLIKGIDLNVTDHCLIATIRDSIWPIMHDHTMDWGYDYMRKHLLLENIVKSRLSLLKIIIAR